MGKHLSELRTTVHFRIEDSLRARFERAAQEDGAESLIEAFRRAVDAYAERVAARRGEAQCATGK